MSEIHASARQLQAVASDYWRAFTDHHPVHATSLAIHDGDHRLDDLSPSALENWKRTLDRLLDRTHHVPVEGLDERETVTREMLLAELGVQRQGADLGMECWSVDQLGGPQVSLLDLVRIHRVVDEPSAKTFLSRVKAMAAHVGQHVSNLRRGLDEGRVASAPTVKRVVEQLDDLVAAGPDQCSLALVAAVAPPSVGGEAWQAFGAELHGTLATEVFPALASYRDFLREKIGPVARAKPGLSALPGGDAVYRQLIRIHCSLDLEPQSLHETGLAEMSRIRGEMEALLAGEMPGRTLREAFAELRTNRSHSFASREEIVAKATSAVRRATEAAKRCFGLLPDHECDVKPMDAHVEKAGPAAYYMGPSPDGTRPGTYYVNTHEPSARPRYEAEVVAFHEAVPGHHLQIALAQQLDGVPDFQRHSHCTAYVEGWALYTERLADELGLYTAPMDRLGMYSCDAWRASRLVVDTGLHALDWSREGAIEYMAENVAASMQDIENEVDRYIAWPGQALSYKTGQLEILRLRREAEGMLGPRFDLKAFHSAVLENGGVTLPILRGHVERWMYRKSTA